MLNAVGPAILRNNLFKAHRAVSEFVDLPSDVSDVAVAKAFTRNTYSLNAASVGGRVGYFLYDDWAGRLNARRLEKAIKGSNRLIGPKRGLVYQEAD